MPVHTLARSGRLWRDPVAFGGIRSPLAESIALGGIRHRRYHAQMPTMKSDSIGLSRFLTWPAAAALGAGLALAIQLTLAETLLTLSGPWLYLAAWLFYLPLLVTWLDMPGEQGPFGLVRLAGYPRLGFWVAWIELGGIMVLAALLAEGAAMGLASFGQRLWGLELVAVDYLPLVIGVVAINELIGTRAHSRVAVLLVLGITILLGVFLLPGRLGPGVSVFEPSTQSSGLAHQMLGPALMASVLWGPHLLLSHRRWMRRRPRGALLPMAVLWLVLPIFGLAGLWVLARHPELAVTSRVPESLNGSGGASVEARLGLAMLMIEVAFCLLGLSLVLAAGIRHGSAMAWGGIAPKSLIRVRSERGVPLVPLVALAGLSWVLARWSDIESLAAGSALALLWLSALVLWPHIQSPAAGRRSASLRLPLHPLMPMLVAAGCLFLSMVLPKTVLAVAAGWLAAGGLCFLLYSRRGLARLELEKHVVGELPAEHEPVLDRVMVAVGEGPTLPTLVQVAGCLADSRNAELLVLKVEPAIEQVTWMESRDLAQLTLERLQATLDRIELPDALEVRPLVRVAPTVVDGILDAASEMEADFLVLGGPREEESLDTEGVVEKVFAATSAGMAVVHGILPKRIGRILVASAGGPHAPTALELGEALATISTKCAHEQGIGDEGDSETGRSQVAILNVVTPAPAIAEGLDAIRQTRESRRRARPESQSSPDEGHDPCGGELVVEASTVAEGMNREAGLQDILLLGATVDRLLGQTRLGGFPSRIAMERRGVTIVVKRGEAAPRFWGRRFWEWLSNPLPRLSDEQRIKVQLAMRNAARAGIDFYILISLSAAIATLGLMQSSAAVVIGAMLVAPLMSPILGMGHAMVRGHLRLVRRAGSSTLKGVGIAVGVGAVFPLLFPGFSPTPEMLARGAPSLLDLAIALASGAAAAYAVSRPSVAAALPGVAIAAALVPPLCVAGFGLGASHLALAAGAMLLFTTNLCAIVLAAAIVFLMLGFRPRQAHRGDAVWRSLALTGLGLAVVSVPLGLQTRDMMGMSKAQRYVTKRLEAAQGETYRVEDLRFDRVAGVLRVRVEILSFEDSVPVERFEALRRDLMVEMGRDVHFELAVSEARRMVMDGSAGTEP